jgi:prepilin-type N-terminal cleavage/methylation domain-containing protein
VKARLMAIRSERQCQYPRTGFTLVELVAALVIGSTLLVATLSVLRTATRYSKLARGDAQLQPALGLLSQQLEHDFINARSIRLGPNSVTIAGYMGKSSQQLALEPAMVVYEIKRAGQQSVLYRSETQPLAVNRRTVRQPVIAGATSLNVIVHSESESDVDVSGISFGNVMRPIPDHLQIVIGDENGHVLFLTDILHVSGLN